jgi:hypothetical protein
MGQEADAPDRRVLQLHVDGAPLIAAALAADAAGALGVGLPLAALARSLETGVADLDVLHRDLVVGAGLDEEEAPPPPVHGELVELARVRHVDVGYDRDLINADPQMPGAGIADVVPGVEPDAQDGRVFEGDANDVPLISAAAAADAAALLVVPLPDPHRRSRGPSGGERREEDRQGRQTPAPSHRKHPSVRHGLQPAARARHSTEGASRLDQNL